MNHLANPNSKNENTEAKYLNNTVYKKNRILR